MILPSLSVRVGVAPDDVLNRFDPRRAFGAAIDGGAAGTTAEIFTPANVRRMRSAGLRSLAYRLRTELAIEAWHWNPAGRWSGRNEGYWTSDSGPKGTIRKSYGYRLPRRGNTFDQADDTDYSRLTDGDPKTFWKSNPDLDDAQPQWLIVRLPTPQTVDAIRVRWGAPYARRYRVEYWAGQNRTDVDGGQEGAWRPFPHGEAKSRGGDETRRLGRMPNVLWLRLRLLASSHTPRRTTDCRDSKGFAVREIEVGRVEAGRFVDLLRHRKDHGQSPTWASSTDPWHRAIDRDPDTEQPGLDLVFRSGLAGGRPVLMPAGVLYDTPANMAALLRWLRARHYPVRGFEMGEEPDGQVCAPEDYAFLYRRTAAALRSIDPRILLGGPGLQTIESDYGAGALGLPNDESWASRFNAALREPLGFFSFEWYPFDDVAADPAAQLVAAPRLLRRALARQKRLQNLPLFMTEYGYSAYAGPAEVDLPGALLNLDAVGTFLAHGGRAAYLYGYPPSPLSEDRKGHWGALAMFLPDGTRLPSYWAARLLTGDWCGLPGSYDLLQAKTDDPRVAAYAVRRPDRRLSLLLLNKDPRRRRTVDLGSKWGNLVQYGPSQYAWHADGPNGRPLRSLPPERSHFAGAFTLPPYSATVAILG